MEQSEIISALHDPSLYPHSPDRVGVIQTHISYLFLAGNEVYKVKKPVNFGFLDFTTLEKRKYYCEEELRLNRRLAPHVYLNVVAITADDKGTIALNGNGEVVEYAVRMKRLPAERMLASLIDRPDFDPSVLDRIANHVGKFHAHAETGGKIDAMGAPTVIKYNHDENFVQTERYIGRTITEEHYKTIKSWVERFFCDHQSLLEDRVRTQRIRDCHGDLHLDHICVDEEITIFDCIEFNERFRYSDVAAEVAFLAMDLDFHGYPAFARRFTHSYIEQTGDTAVGTLHDFYKCYYAYVRGKVVSFRLDDGNISPEEREAARLLAERYFLLAHRYVTATHRPLLMIMAGLTGTGKSVLTRELARRLGAAVIQTDVIRKELAGIEPDTHRYEEAGEGIYSPDMSARTYEEARRKAQNLLLAGQSVILDATHIHAREREAAYRLAQAAGADCYLILCECPEETVKERLLTRMNEKGEVSDGRWEIYLHQRDRFEPVDPGWESFISVDTSRPLKETIEHVFKAMVQYSSAPHQLTRV